jgi:hypothetical protein
MLIIIGAALLISGIVISVLWVGSFANSFLRQGIIPNNVALAPSETGRNTIRITYLSHPIVLQVRFESSDNSSSSQNRQQPNTGSGNHLS